MDIMEDQFKNCEAFNALKPKQKLFVLEYLKDYNATQAAIRAGYSKKTARSIGQENLTKPDIQSALKEVSEVIVEKPSIASLQEIAEFLTAVKRGNMADVCSWSEDGLKFTKNSEEMPREVSRLIKKIKTTTRVSAKGDYTETEINLELHDPIKAAELLGRYHGMFIDKKELSGPNGGPIETVEQKVIFYIPQNNRDGETP